MAYVKVKPNTKKKQDQLFDLYKKGVKIEVSCPWWAKNHWEHKTNVQTRDVFFAECTYRYEA